MRPSLRLLGILGFLWIGIATTVWAEQVVVRVRRANLRAAPRLNAPVITQVPQGQFLEVIERTDGWLKVRYGDIVGFIADSLVEPAQPSATLTPSPPPRESPPHSGSSPRSSPAPRASRSTGTGSIAHIGATLSIAEDADVGLGIRFLWGLHRVLRNLELATTFDYFFPGGGISYFEINGNFLYNFHLQRTALVHMLALD